MTDGTFSIFGAVKNAYIFLWRNASYLLKLAALPIVVQIFSSLLVREVRPDASIVESWLWNLPAATVCAVFIYLQTRLLLLGEKKLDTRADTLKVSVITALLFNMGQALGMIGLLSLSQAPKSLPFSLLAIALMILMFWGLRFGALPILGAVNEPFRPFLHRVRGPLFSMRLFSMGLLALFPLMLLMQLVLPVLLGGMDPANMNNAAQTAIIAVGGALSVLVASLLNAAAAFAVKEIMA